ncbi:MAG: hypothetical protein JST54_01965 [Deltaproteobacteria bacterium]|nr:hypothetical protein [Deltaproteobacteria bacterium]
MLLLSACTYSAQDESHVGGCYRHQSLGTTLDCGEKRDVCGETIACECPDGGPRVLK